MNQNKSMNKNKNVKNKNVKINIILSFLTLSMVASACKNRSFNSETLAASRNQYTAADFYNGLNAAPGTPARKKAGIIFETELLQKTFASIPNSSDAETAKNQKLTLKVLSLTSQYLQKSTGCTQAQKIRLYRGHGFAAALQPGTQIIETQLSNAWFQADKKPLNMLPWKKWFAEMRSFITPEGGDTDIDLQYRFDRLAVAHTLDSKSSALLSTTVSRKVAEGFGTKQFVLDVCPERVFPVLDTRYLSEFEYYMPLFILPEEIVADVNKGESLPPSVSAPSTLGERVWSCFANLGTNLEVARVSEEATEIRESGGDDNSGDIPYTQRYKTVRNKIYEGVLASTDFAAWRTDFARITEQCAVDCKLAQNTLESERERFKNSGAMYTKEKKLALDGHEKEFLKRCK